MRNSLRSAFAKAARLATASLDDVAESIGRGASTLYAYLSGARRVTPGAARELAAYLRERARAFTKAADRLDAAADREEGSGR
jgi:hypothetical protein